MARLVRRTGFGATGDEVDAAMKEGASSYVARILRADPSADPGARRTPAPTFAVLPARGGKGKSGGSDDPDSGNTKGGDDERKHAYRRAARVQDDQLTRWWLQRMIAAETAFGEKATFVWHSHFATSLKKVKVADLMLRHNKRQRALATGDFRTLAYTMLIDDAVQLWLDNQRNTVQGPNENLSREFMEIFTLGHGDGYTETDVREGARALTGYKPDPKTRRLTLRPQLHDSRSKSVLGRTGDLGAREFCDAVLARPESADYIVGRLYARYVSNTAPDAAVRRRLVAGYGEHLDLSALLRTMLLDESFTAAEGSFVTGPVEWLIGAVRALGLAATSDKELRPLRRALEDLGQLPFYPPSVGGWPFGAVWMTTASADLRFGTATQLVARADLDFVHGSTTARLEALAHRLGVASWSTQTAAVLKGAASDPRRLVAVALNTPEYLVH